MRRRQFKTLNNQGEECNRVARTKVAFYARMRDGGTKVDNATVRDGVVVSSEVAVRDRHDTCEIGLRVGEAVTDLIAQGFHRVPGPVLWTWGTSWSTTHMPDSSGNWTHYPTTETADNAGD